jgi:hypothetical protein
VSAGPQPQIDPNLIEQARKQINKLAEEIAQLSEQDLAPADYYGEFLQRVLTAIAAPAGAVWIRTPQGNLQLQYQINLREVGIDRNEETRGSHDELLRQAFLKGQPGFFPPHSGLGKPESGGPAAGNPTDFVILLAPILVEKQVAGVVEVWQDPNRGPEAQRGFLHFLVRMAGLAAGYTRNHNLRQMTGQQQVWTQLEAFARQVHATLNPTEVAYMTANEGRRLVECDRVSVAVRRGTRTTIEAISGADVVEKRSNLVQLMRALADSVIVWGEKLVYSGIKDDTLPPNVLQALDEYLAESNSKLLVILPLLDERDKEKKKKGRSALVMECFDPSATPDQLVARLEVVGKHATTALYNAVEHRRIPMRFIWAPIAKVQEGVGGKGRAIIYSIVLGVIALMCVFVFVPADLKVEGKGKLLPKKRAMVYSDWEGTVIGFKGNIQPGFPVTKGQDLIQMNDDNLGKQITELMAERAKEELKYKNASAQELEAKSKGNVSPTDLAAIIRDKGEAEFNRDLKSLQLRRLQKRVNANLQNPGEFWVKSPMTGMVLTSDFRENYTNRRVKPSEFLLRIGYAKPSVEDWEIELKIPQKGIGKVRKAFLALKANEELWVDLMPASAPTVTYKGKLARNKVSPEALPNKDDNNEPEPVVLAWVRIDGNDIPKEYRMPRELLLTGTEVTAKVRCGEHAWGYTLFHPVWEFICEKKFLWF